MSVGTLPFKHFQFQSFYLYLCRAGWRAHQAAGVERQHGDQAAQHPRAAFLPEHSRRHPELRAAIQR